LFSFLCVGIIGHLFQLFFANILSIDFVLLINRVLWKRLFVILSQFYYSLVTDLISLSLPVIANQLLL
jgi:hypothetical protein